MESSTLELSAECRGPWPLHWADCSPAGRLLPAVWCCQLTGRPDQTTHAFRPAVQLKGRCVAANKRRKKEKKKNRLKAYCASTGYYTSGSCICSIPAWCLDHLRIVDVYGSQILNNCLAVWSRRVCDCLGGLAPDSWLLADCLPFLTTPPQTGRHAGPECHADIAVKTPGTATD